MGRLVMVKCDCGYVCERFRYGVNSAYEEVKKHQTALAKSGRYGKQWKELLDSDSELRVNAEYKIYQCPCCHQICSEHCMDLYKPGKYDGGYYTATSEEVVYHYKHLCPDCKKKMTEIPLSLDRYGNVSEEEPVICPECGDVAIASFCGFTD